MIRNPNQKIPRKPGDVIKMICSSCEGRGRILTRPLKAELEEDEEKFEENSVVCTECSGSGRVEAIVQGR